LLRRSAKRGRVVSASLSNGVERPRFRRDGYRCSASCLTHYWVRGAVRGAPGCRSQGMRLSVAVPSTPTLAKPAGAKHVEKPFSDGGVSPSTTARIPQCCGELPAGGHRSGEPRSDGLVNHLDPGGNSTSRGAFPRHEPRSRTEPGVNFREQGCDKTGTRSPSQLPAELQQASATLGDRRGCRDEVAEDAVHVHFHRCHGDKGAPGRHSQLVSNWCT
jgi:hypothetical protein